MGSEWMEVKLSDLGEVSRGRSRHRPRYAEHLYGGSYPFIQTGDIKASEGRINSHEQTYSEAGLAQSRLWPTNTMCITIAANIAETGILQYPACFPDSVIGFIADEGKCDVYFIEYLFRNLRRDLQRQATGSVQDNINLQTLERLKFKVPLLNEQKRISSFLNNFENKIILNQKINQTLEQMAQALFKSWFVDFDPVIDNALDAGNTIPEPLQTRAELRQAVRKKDDFKPLPQAIRELFPNKFEESELGWIPKGWEVSNVGKEFKITMGQSPPGSTYNEIGEGMPFFQGKTDFGFRFPSNRIYCTEPKRIAYKNDTLISVRAPVGSINLAVEDCVIGRGLAAARHKSKSVSFTFYAMNNLANYFEVFEGEGTVFGSINQKDFGALPQLSFSEELIRMFDTYCSNLDMKIDLSSRQIEELTKLRDTLLPKLISGELSLADIELD